MGGGRAASPISYKAQPGPALRHRCGTKRRPRPNGGRRGPRQVSRWRREHGGEVKSREVALSYARVLGGKALIQKIMEDAIEGVLVSLCRLIYLSLALCWAACANSIRYVVYEGAFKFDLALRVEPLQQLGLAFYSFVAVEPRQQLGLAFYSFVG
jgi:hypothetical protein